MPCPLAWRYVIRLLTITTAAVALLIVAAPARAEGPPRSFVEQALCVHSGWHWTSHRPSAAPPELVLWHHGYWKTWDVPDGYAGGSGEGSWGWANGLYGGGMSFMVGTWNRAAALSRGRLRVPYVSSTWDIARQSPLVQVKAAFLIWQQDGGSWREWPQTSRACGY